MTRFMFGILAGLLIICGLMVVLALVFPPAGQKAEPESAQAPAVPSQDVVTVVPVVEKRPSRKIETQVVASLKAKPDLEPKPAPNMSAEQVAQARSAFNAVVVKTASPVQAVPEAAVAQTQALVDQTQTPQPVSDGTWETTPGYFEVWDDLMQRCYDVVAQQDPLNEAGLTPLGEERVDYAQTYSEQKWTTADKAFSLRVKTRGGDARTGVLRTCVLEANRFVPANKMVLRKLKGRFHDWWQKERYAEATVDQKYPYTLSDKHRWYGGLTRYGSAQGCAIKVEFSEITLGKDTEAKLFLTESDKTGCDLSPGSGSGPGGKVRVNRMPQAGN